MVLGEHEEDEGGGKEEEVDLPKGCSEGEWPWIVKSPPDARREDIKKNEQQRKRKKFKSEKEKKGERENRGMITQEAGKPCGAGVNKCQGTKDYFIKQGIGAIG